jgi:hypothetical protein
MAARTDYEPPLGYPEKESKEGRFDYYSLLQKMGRHTEWLRELPNQALCKLGKWTQRAHDILLAWGVEKLTRV